MILLTLFISTCTDEVLLSVFKQNRLEYNYQQNLEYLTVNKDVNYQESAKNMPLTCKKQRYLNGRH